LGSIAAFHKAVASHSRALSPGETLHLVLSSARALLGEGFYAAVGQFDAQDAWRLLVLDVDGRLKRSQVIEEPLGPGVRGRSLASLMDSSQLRIEAMGVLPSLSDLLHDAPDIRGIRSMLIPIAPGSQAAALILHDRPIESLLPSATQREALTGTWSAALTAAAQHHAAQRLGERLAVSGRALAEAQDKAGEAATMARLKAEEKNSIAQELAKLIEAPKPADAAWQGSVAKTLGSGGIAVGKDGAAMLADWPSIAWQILAYIVITAAEVLVSVTCLEFSYTQSPPKMKSFIMSLYLLSVSAGNALTALVNRFTQDASGNSTLEGARYYWFFTGLMLAATVVYVVVSRFYKGREYLQDTPGGTAEAAEEAR
jgi:hypothetical protein